MSARKTLKLSDSPAASGPVAIDKKGRGWEISEKRLDSIHTQARAMRCEPTPAHKALAERFAKADLGRYTFKRHAVIGSAIVDFACNTIGMAIVIDEEGVDPAITTRRDRSLEAVGVRVMHIAARDILDNIDPVLERITMGMRVRIADKQQARRAHHAVRQGDGPSRGRVNRNQNATHR